MVMDQNFFEMTEKSEVSLVILSKNVD